MDAKCIHKPLSTNSFLLFFFFPSAGYFPCTIPLIFLLPSLRLLQKSFPTSIIFFPSICQAFLKSCVFWVCSSHPEVWMQHYCCLLVQAIPQNRDVFPPYQVKMTLLKNIPSLVWVKGTWEKSMVQIIKDLVITTWSEALESQTDLKKILPLCNCCLWIALIIS